MGNLGVKKRISWRLATYTEGLRKIRYNRTRDEVREGKYKTG